MKLKQLIEYVKNNYPSKNSNKFENERFKDNETVSILSAGLNTVDNRWLFLNDKFISNGSAGISRWAIVPWIALFDTNITSSAKEGFYIVYLFSADLKYVYLSLNQGWSFYQDTYGKKEGLKNVKRVSSYWQKSLNNRTDRMSTGGIDLHASEYKGTTLPLGYEQGNILSIRYDLDSLPEDDRLVSDLLDMRNVLKELERKLLLPEKLSSSILYILKKGELEDSDTKTNLEHQKQNKKIFSNEQEMCKTGLPQNRLPRKVVGKLQRDIDYGAKERYDAKLGFIGELLVVEYEKARLKRENRGDLAKVVEQVSRTQGDGLGYDIRSYTKDGEPRFIEVKTTQGDINTPFYLSRNEMEASNRYGNAYELFRVYDVMDNKKFYTVTGPLEKSLETTVQSYKALPRVTR